MIHIRSAIFFGAVLLLLLGLQITAGALDSKKVFTCEEPKAQQNQDFPERDEFRKSYQLLPGARVEVSVIYGVVDIETAETNVAEIHIVRLARSRQDFSSRKIDIEHTSTSLVVRGEQDRSDGPARVRHQVLLRLPRRVELSVQRINGRVIVGEIDGTVQFSRINGAVKVAQAVASADVTSINGSVTLTIAGLREGIRASDINGAIELRFPDNLNADLVVTNFNGGVSTDVANVAALEKTPRTIFRARIGTGGIPISINDVNGGVRLARATE
jgi:DUF4097 and DUF4098 domain-containing protein YvlB